MKNQSGHKEAPAHGQELRAKVMARKAQLEKRLAEEKEKVYPGQPYLDTSGIATTLAVVEDLLTGDPKNIIEPTATHLSQWLESSRSLLPSDPIVKPTANKPGK